MTSFLKVFSNKNLKGLYSNPSYIKPLLEAIAVLLTYTSTILQSKVFLSILVWETAQVTSPPPHLHPAWLRPPAAGGVEALTGWWQKSERKKETSKRKLSLAQKMSKTKLQCLHKGLRKWKVPDLQTSTSKWNRIRSDTPLCLCEKLTPADKRARLLLSVWLLFQV